MFKVKEEYRLKKGEMATSKEYGNNGVFMIPHPKIAGYVFACIASDGSGIENEIRWEHVSVHLQSNRRKVDRCPTWQEMCFIKDIFWSEEDCVVQYHPARKDYVNIHPTTLHLWRPRDEFLVVPPKWMV